MAGVRKTVSDTAGTSAGSCLFLPGMIVCNQLFYNLNLKGKYMIKIITQIDEITISSLLSVYSESMDDMKTNFATDTEMCVAYASFLREFAKKPNQLIIVETFNDEWVSALRAIETTEGHWFLEAVETKPNKRKKGFGKDLLLHTIDYLKNRGMTEITCTISHNNHKSQALHGKCGFIPTNDAPLNCWGEFEEGTILYRLDT